LGGMFTSAITDTRYAMLIDDNSNYYSTRFFYDKLGRMVVSQNSKQYNKVPKAFSYTKYDDLGRINEVGEKSENTEATTFRKIFGSDVGGLFNGNTINNDSLKSWLAGNGARKEVTRTYYDIATFNGLPMAQENLRKRVADVTYEDVDDEEDSTYQHATHYTYDIHGNVRSIIQDNPMVNVTSQRYKQIDYDFDLISGKINRVIYQPEAPDMFIHRYEYDEDNRITRVETSTDDVIYQTDAKYFYYAHGPLARVEYGKNQVQGMDYAYTLQGWIKGVNSNTLSSSRDMGRDGYMTDTTNDNYYFAEDAFGYTLGYYAGDYKAISNLKWNTVSNRFEAQTAGAQFEGQRHNLYNGNISHMVSTIVERDTAVTGLLDPQMPKPLANAYKYDQLNRLKKSLSFNNINIPSNLWSASGQAVSNMYENTFTYDANGNILTQNRYDEAGVKFENMDYRYKKDANGDYMQNRLYHVNDSASSGLQTDDIDDQGAFNSTIASMNTVNNYSYDEIGNLIADSTEQVDTIKWTAYGKVKEIKRSSGSSKKNLKFEYDATGHRIAKQILTSANSWEKTIYYVRDVRGNVMSTYEENAVDSSFSFKLKEQHLYGSSRIGMANPDKEMIDADSTNEFAFDTLNKRQYEMVNNLGSVLLIAFDRKIALDTNSDGLIDIHQVDIASARDYSSFGAQLYGRGFVSDAYRYGGAGGQEEDSEIYGEGNSYTAEYWQYDPRLGRRWNIDPVNFEWQSTYAAFNNNPIYFTDPTGLTGEKPKTGDTRTHEGKEQIYGEDGTWQPLSTGGEAIAYKTEKIATETKDQTEMPNEGDRIYTQYKIEQATKKKKEESEDFREELAQISRKLYEQSANAVENMNKGGDFAATLAHNKQLMTYTDNLDKGIKKAKYLYNGVSLVTANTVEEQTEAMEGLAKDAADHVAGKFIPWYNVASTFKDVHDLIESSEEMILTRYRQASIRYSKKPFDRYLRSQAEEAYEKALPIMQKYGLRR
ncbi:MAG TPA: hypothetical protein VF691_15565, partial [Cytophagaceae bacterium]